MRLGSFLVLLHQSTTDGTAMASTGVAVNVDKIRYSLFSISMRSGEMESKPTWVRQLVVSYRIPASGLKNPFINISHVQDVLD